MTADETAPTYNASVWPDFVPGVRVSRCGLGSSHGPHHVDVGPDQPRNCPGTGKWVRCPRCMQAVPAISPTMTGRHQVDGEWCSGWNQLEASSR